MGGKGSKEEFATAGGAVIEPKYEFVEIGLCMSFLAAAQAT